MIPEIVFKLALIVLFVKACDASVNTTLFPVLILATPPVWSVTINSSEEVVAGPNSNVDAGFTDGLPSLSRTVKVPAVGVFIVTVDPEIEVDVPPVPVKVRVPPKATDPVPLFPAKLTLLLVSEAFPIFDNVLVAPEIVLFVKISLDEAVIYPLLLVHCEIFAEPKFAVVKPDIAVGVTPVTLPCASVVNTGMEEPLPYVPAVPVFGSDRVVVPPSDTVPPPVSPVPAVTVNEEFASAALAMDAAGKVTVPEEIVNPFDPVRSPAEVIVPVPVVEMFPVVEIVILAAKSEPVTDEKVGRPDALP